MLCPKCGRECGESKFCVNCGANLDQTQYYNPVPDAQHYEQQRQSEPYPQPAPQVMQQENASVLSMGEYMLMHLLLLIPVVGLVMLFVWGFSDGTNLNKRNWARAELIWALIGVVITILIIALVITVRASVFSNLDSVMESVY